MMATDLADAIHGFLLRSMLPLLVASPGPSPSAGPRLRGVVRADEAHARVALSADDRMASGVAAEFVLRSLMSDGRLTGVEKAVDHVRGPLASDLGRYLVGSARPRDSHHNVIVRVDLADASVLAGEGSPDQGLFRLLSLLDQGGDPAWFHDVFTFTGFMLQPAGRCRIYLRATESGRVHGVEIPLRHGDGRAIFGIGGSLVQELAALVREGDLAVQPRIDDRDDYCDDVVDMTGWVDPPPSAP